MKKNILFIGFIIGVILLSTNCANQGTPTGGPKDTLAPFIKKIVPLNQSTNFKGNKISIKFNEFVQLKDLGSNLLVSPPIENKPEVGTKGKGIVIKIKDTLAKNTTYVINFGEAIADYTEGNPIHDFKYILSTGDYVDSLWIMGTINDAYTLLPVENVFIGLYKDLSDSVPYLKKPSFIAKSRVDGIFNLSNLPKGVFKVFAIHDKNANLKYDNGEELAFFDFFIKIDANGYELVDADQHVLNYRDSSGFLKPEYAITENHVILDDSLQYVDFLNLKLFLEDKEHQYLMESKREVENKLDLVFNKPHPQNISIQAIDFERTSDWFLFEKNPDEKTFSFWIIDTTLCKLDTLNLRLKYYKTDSIYQYVEQIDTLVFRFIHEQKKERKTLFGKNNKEEVVETGLSIEYNVSGATLDLGKNLIVIFKDPLENVDQSKIKLETAKGEEAYKPVDFKFYMDSISYLKYHVVREWLPEEKYKLTFEQGAFKNYYGLENDSIVKNFRTQAAEVYGRIILTFKNVSVPHQFLLLDEKEKIVREHSIRNDTVISIDYLQPKLYVFKAYEDLNMNQKWDVGDYLKHKQAEKIKYYMPENEIEKITIKANWENEITWDLKSY